MTDPISLEYLAGFFDGEGHMTDYVRGQRSGKLRGMGFVLGFTQNGPAGLHVLQRIKDSLEHYDPDVKCRSIQSGSPRTDKHLEGYTLLFWGKAAVKAAQLLEPLLIVKKGRAHAFIDSWNEYQKAKDSNGKEAVQDLVRRKYLQAEVRAGAGGYMGRLSGKGGGGCLWKPVGDRPAPDVYVRPRTTV